MALPAMTAERLLPLGRHRATLPELHLRFVVEAPQRARRQLIFDALAVYAELTWALLPGARLWVDGGFVTHKQEPPNDVDVAIVLDPTVALPVETTEEVVLPLLTMQGVTYVKPAPGGYVERLQPFGGLIDGFLALDELDRQFWAGWWSRHEGSEDRKGFVEVVAT